MSDINGVISSGSVSGKVHATEIKVEIQGTGPKGTNGKSLQYSWDGTRLGVRIEGETEYTYSELKPDVPDKAVIHDQIAVSKDWNILHNMDKYPSVTVVDSAGSVVVGEIEYVDMNTLRLHFTAEFSGKAYLN